MDGRRFDALARQLAAAGTSRRRFLRILGGGVIAGVGVAAGRDGADAAICRAGGVLCVKDAQCCSGTCDADSHRCACFDGEILCRNRCIPACTAIDECHVAGECDPSYGVCTNPPADAGTTCGQGPRCADDVATAQDTCDGSGTCTTGETTECTPYVCGATACLTSCGGADSACIDGDYCASNQCLPKQQAGTSCAGGNQCLTGYCVDGVCCDSACTDQCAACNLSGNVGTCSPVTGAPVGDRAACASDGSVCGGSCNGTDTASCAYPGNDTSCRDASCADNTETFAAGCDGAGACPAAQTQSCGSYICGSDACLTSCDHDDQCLDAAYCDTTTNTCKQDLSNGQTCSRDHQCTSGFCIDGVCCDTACAGQCAACNLTGHVGTCSPVTGAPVGGRAACASDGSVCGGTCNGTIPTSCTYPGNETTCRAASCSGGHQTNSATCNGNGACPAATGKDCTPYVCGATACLTSCTTEASCISGDYCGTDHQCHPKVANGVGCGTSNQCTSGHCVGGVCCDSACTAPCNTCAGGTCHSSCTGGKICQSNTCVCPSGQTDCSGTCSSLNTTDHCGACGTSCPSPCGAYYYPSCYQDIDGSHHFCGAGGYCKKCSKDSDCLGGYRCIGGQTPVPGCPETTLCIATC